MLLLLLQVGLASVYVDREVFCPGERYDSTMLIAAHRTIPCGSRVKITNRRSGQAVTVRIVDRGPFKPGRIVDLTPYAAKKIGLDGLEEVTLEQLD
jgi:rare lipoprotein A